MGSSSWALVREPSSNSRSAARSNEVRQFLRVRDTHRHLDLHRSQVLISTQLTVQKHGVGV